MNSDKEPMIGYPIMLPCNLFSEAAEDVRAFRLAMETNPHLTIREAITILEPIISRVYQWVLGHDQDSWMLYSTLCRAPSVLNSSLTALNPLYDPQGTFGPTVRIHGKDVPLKEYVIVQRGPQTSVSLREAFSIFCLEWLPAQPEWNIKGAEADAQRLRLLGLLAKISHTQTPAIPTGTPRQTSAKCRQFTYR